MGKESEHIPVAPDGDQVLAGFAAQLTRRYGANNLLRMASDTAGDWHWTLSSRAGEAERAGGPGLPEPIEDCFACISLSNPLAPGAVDDVHRVLANACGGLFFSPLDTLTDTARIRERVAAYEQMLNEHGLAPEFVGARLGTPGERRLLSIFSGPDRHFRPPPAAFRVLALITAFNEEDVITQVVTHLAQQGVDVILVDNWSTDATVAKAESMLGKGLIRVEKFPPTGPSSSFDWDGILRYKAELASAERADWFIHHDADEIRESPWPEMTLRDALYEVDVRGFNAVDHTQLDFHPTTAETFGPDDSLEAKFGYFSPASVVALDYRVNAWKNLGYRVDLSTSGGHSVLFPGRRVFPYNFLLKHYPIRSQAHGEQKVLRERKPRWDAGERRRGWHFQYDHIRAGHRFIRPTGDLLRFDESFYEVMLIERLSAIGLHEEPARYSWRSRRLAIDWLRRLGILEPAVRVQRRVRAALRRDVSLGNR